MWGKFCSTTGAHNLLILSNLSNNSFALKYSLCYILLYYLSFMLILYIVANI